MLSSGLICKIELREALGLPLLLLFDGAGTLASSSELSTNTLLLLALDFLVLTPGVGGALSPSSELLSNTLLLLGLYFLLLPVEGMTPTPVSIGDSFLASPAPSGLLFGRFRSDF